MVKLTGPLFSMGASGTIGNTITYARKGGTAYARQRVVPFNPRSPGQTGFRAMFKFLSQNWAGLDTPQKNSWQALADSLSGQKFNAYMHDNQKLWQQFGAPHRTYPNPGTGSVDTSANTTVMGQVGQVTGTYLPVAPTDNWGQMIFRSDTTGFTTAISNCVLIVLMDSTGLKFWVDSPVPAGDWFYNYRNFTTEGILGAEIGEDPVTVT